MAKIKLKNKVKRYRFRSVNYDAGKSYDVNNELASYLVGTGKFEPVVNYDEPDEDDVSFDDEDDNDGDEGHDVEVRKNKPSKKDSQRLEVDGLKKKKKKKNKGDVKSQLKVSKKKGIQVV